MLIELGCRWGITQTDKRSATQILEILNSVVFGPAAPPPDLYYPLSSWLWPWTTSISPPPYHLSAWVRCLGVKSGEHTVRVWWCWYDQNICTNVFAVFFFLIIFHYLGGSIFLGSKSNNLTFQPWPEILLLASDVWKPRYWQIIQALEYHGILFGSPCRASDDRKVTRFICNSIFVER